MTDHASAVSEFVAAARRFPSGAWTQALAGSHLLRWLLRRTMLPAILRGRPFPAGARAPSETLPRELHADPTSALAALEFMADAFARELSAGVSGQRRQLSHAYFGPVSLRQSLRLAAVHTRHHARQLEGGVGRKFHLCGPE